MGSYKDFEEIMECFLGEDFRKRALDTYGRIRDKFMQPAPEAGNCGGFVCSNVNEVVHADSENGKVIHLALPGVGKSNVQVNVCGRVLTVSLKEVGDKELKFVDPKFTRKYVLDAWLNPYNAVAKVSDGVLTVVIPPAKKDEPRNVGIDVE